MNYEVIKSCMIKGQKYQVGQEVTLDTITASALMGNGRIVPKDESKVENRAVGLEESDSKPKTRRRKKAPEPAPEPEAE